MRQGMPSTTVSSLLAGSLLLMCHPAADRDDAEPTNGQLLASVAGELAGVKVDSVRLWNEQALSTFRARKSTDAEAARTLAMLNVAMYDAVNGIESRCGGTDRSFALVPPDDSVPSNASVTAAASAAAHAVLVGLFPDRAAAFAAQLEADLAALGTSKKVKAGRAWGASVGSRVVALRADDGSAGNEVAPPSQGVGKFPLSWSGIQFRNLRPFAVADSAAYMTPGPPALGTVDYAADFAEVKLVGNAAIPDPEKSFIFQYWSLAGGTVQPPGEWVRIGLNVAGTRNLDLHDKTRLFALLAMALADVVAPTVGTKLTYAHWRPATAIVQAAEDENPFTDPDPTWKPRAGGAGGTPEHTSGHSSFSSAAATVLAGFFCHDSIPFTHVSDSSPGAQSRSYISFSQAAAEAGRSRIFGGLHFEFSNQSGLAVGKAIGEEVLTKMLLRKKGKTHVGQCPL
jgi:hypothetical protein